MKIVLSLCALLWLSNAVPAVARSIESGPSGVDLGARATAQLERIDSVDSYVQGLRDAVELARAGEYGRIKRKDLDRLEAAQLRIASLLEGRASALDLPLEQRIEVYNAQESINAILRNDEKSRMVCRRVANTGTRIPITECLTVAEREARARGARKIADKLPQPTCIPGQGAGC